MSDLPLPPLDVVLSEEAELIVLAWAREAVAAQWNDAIEAAARLAETRPGEAAFVKAIRALKREPR